MTGVAHTGCQLAPSSAIASRRLCLLSNGTYRVMLSDSSSGVGRWRDLSVTRWREDVTRDQYAITRGVNMIEPTSTLAVSLPPDAVAAATVEFAPESSESEEDGVA